MSEQTTAGLVTVLLNAAKYAECVNDAIFTDSRGDARTLRTLADRLAATPPDMLALARRDAYCEGYCDCDLAHCAHRAAYGKLDALLDTLAGEVTR